MVEHLKDARFPWFQLGSAWGEFAATFAKLDGEAETVD